MTTARLLPELRRVVTRPSVVDAGLACLAAAVTVPLAILGPDAWPDVGRFTPVLAVVASLALLARRRHPVPVAVAVAIATAMAPVVMVPLFIALYGVGAYVARSVALAVWAGVAIEVVALQAIDDGASGLVRGPVIASALGFPVVLGMAVDARSRLMAELVSRAERAEREQGLLAAAAVAAERARLAREMHDVVAHRVSLMVLHASAIELSGDAAPDPGSSPRSDAAEAALIGTIGRQALDELRQMLDVLRDRGEPVPLAPLPGIVEVHDLAAASRSAGLTVTVLEDGDVAAVPGSVSRTAYRVVQEGLTNVHKHAAGAAVDIHLRRCPVSLDIEVVNDRPTGAPGSGAAPAPVPGGGHGLTGLRERVALLGGRVVAEPTPEGGWAVLARLPVP